MPMYPALEWLLLRECAEEGHSPYSRRQPKGCLFTPLVRKGNSWNNPPRGYEFPHSLRTPRAVIDSKNNFIQAGALGWDPKRLGIDLSTLEGWEQALRLVVLRLATPGVSYNLIQKLFEGDQRIWSSLLDEYNIIRLYHKSSHDSKVRDGMRYNSIRTLASAWPMLDAPLGITPSLVLAQTLEWRLLRLSLEEKEELRIQDPELKLLHRHL